ncbi:MAG: magnesium/cobalt transporter CorA [Candidatus Methylomirabilales bacterium]
MTSLHSWVAELEGRLWVDLTGPGVEEMETVGRCFGFHPLTIEDCLHGGQRPKLESYDGYLFLVLHALPQGIDNSCDVEDLDEIYVYATPQALVTVHQRDSEAVSKLHERLRQEPVLLTQPAGFLLHFLADSVVDQFFPFLDRLEEEIDDLEDRVLIAARPALLRRLFAYKRTLIHLRKSLSPLREVFNGLSRRDYPLLDPKSALYFRDVYDHLIRASEIVETCRDLVATTVEVYLSAVSNRMNDIMRQLTIMATIFLPLSVITGFFGMNFEHIPWKNPVLFVLTVTSIVAVPVVMLRWFARRGWLQSEPVLPKKPERRRDPSRKKVP